MRPFHLSELTGPLAGTLHGADVAFTGVSTDSRTVGADQLFVALRGEQFDGHRFVGRAAEAGACGALVSDAPELPLPLLEVSDTLKALGQLGALNRHEYQGVLVGITGSCGKTSVKNMLATILSGAGPTLATRGNFNNEIGMPLTLLELNAEHRYAVVEMGAGKPGDIAYLCSLARPGISVLLNALPAHLETMGSVKDIATTKGEILSGLGGDGTAIFPAESEFSDLWRRLAGTAQRLEFGFAPEADVSASEINLDGEGLRFTLTVRGESAPVAMAVPGRHNVANALAAAAAAYAAGLPVAMIAARLADVKPAGGRLRPVSLAGGIVLIDDSYNANPASVKAAVDVLAARAGRRVLVLGAMAELGPQSEALHAEVGRYAADQGIDVLWATGSHCRSAVDAFGEDGRFFEDREALIAELKLFLAAGDAVLVKGSRSAGMDAVVAALSNDASANQGKS